ncbi:MAG: DnaB-like helicase C-terminal domain-containing protein [Candidatus Saccharibacteria bacterium]
MGTNGRKGRATLKAKQKNQFNNGRIRDLKAVADLPDWDPVNTGAVSSGLEDLDQVLGGGFRPGELTIWSGVNSSGKSTLLGQMLLEAIDQGQGVCAYSGELPDRVFRYWLELQAAGPLNLEGEVNPAVTGMVYRPRPEVIPVIRDWYRDKLFLYDAAEMDSRAGLLAAFASASREYGCRVFLLDNLTMTVSRLNARDQYRAQRELILEMVNFARETPAHVHVVVHPRKTAGTARMTKNDIGGSGDITNLADNVLVLARPTMKELRRQVFAGDALLTVLKNRFGGRQDVDIYLGFDQTSRRFHPVGGRPENKQYGWENSSI